MSNILASDIRICQIVTANGFDTGYTFLYHLSIKNQISPIWFRLPQDIIIASGIIKINEEFNFFLGKFSNQKMPTIERVEGEEDTYRVSNFSGRLTDAIFDVQKGSVLLISLSQFGFPDFYRFARFTL
jgi:hypothetical protein